MIDLKPGIVAEIRQVDSDRDSGTAAGQIFHSKIIRVNPDDTVDLMIPVLQEKEITLLRNTRYSFLFIQDQTMKTAQGVFLQRIRVDNVPMAKVKLVTQLRKIQRRDYYRLGCNLDLIFQVVRIHPAEIDSPHLLTKLEEELDDDRWFGGTIIDISGGGMKFVSDAPIMDLPFIYSNFFLDIDGKVINVKNTGKILDRQPVPRSLQCTYRVKFVPEHTKAQDSILAYIYSRQRSLAGKK